MILSIVVGYSIMIYEIYLFIVCIIWLACVWVAFLTDCDQIQ